MSVVKTSGIRTRIPLSRSLFRGFPMGTRSVAQEDPSDAGQPASGRDAPPSLADKNLASLAQYPRKRFADF